METPFSLTRPGLLRSLHGLHGWVKYIDMALQYGEV